MIRTSPFPFEVDFGIIGKPTDDAFSFTIPFINGVKHAVIVTNIKENTLKVVPIPYSSAALLRIKTVNMAAIQMEMMRVMKECNMKLLYTNGICEDVDCYWEGIVKDDPGFIETFTTLKREKNGLIDNVLVLFLDMKYTGFKKLVEKHDLEWLIKSFLCFEISKSSVMDGLREEMEKRREEHRLPTDARDDFVLMMQYIQKHVI